MFFRDVDLGWVLGRGVLRSDVLSFKEFNEFQGIGFCRLKVQDQALWFRILGVTGFGILGCGVLGVSGVLGSKWVAGCRVSGFFFFLVPGS